MAKYYFLKGSMSERPGPIQDNFSLQNHEPQNLDTNQKVAISLLREIIEKNFDGDEEQQFRAVELFGVVCDIVLKHNVTIEPQYAESLKEIFQFFANDPRSLTIVSGDPVGISYQGKMRAALRNNNIDLN